MADWLSELRARCEQSSITEVAAEIGYSRAAVSRVLSGSYSGTKRIADRVTQSFMRHHCPHLDHEITGSECREIASRPFNTSSPMAARQWRACQNCPRNPVRKP